MCGRVVAPFAGVLVRDNVTGKYRAVHGNCTTALSVYNYTKGKWETCSA